jgi:hypothetical protein
MCNPFYTAYFTLPQRDRVSVLQVLLGGEAPTYRYNEEAVRLLEQFKLAQKWRKRLEGLEWEREWSKAELTQWLKQHLPGIGKEGSKLVYDALAIAAYHGQQEWPVVQTLVCDDAPQFNYLTVELLLCWIHQGRPFKKLEPRLEYHRKILETFMGQFWNYYDQLLEYTREQREGQAERLEAEFDRIFQAGGEYEQLDAQILKVKANKAHLLLVLKNPKLPLHNNPAELGARQRVRKLDVSLSVFSEAGLAAWDCFQTILGTAKKLGVNTYAYLLDRISGKLALPSLASLIREKGQAGEYSYYPSEKSQKASQARRAKKGLGGRKAQTPLAVTPVSQPPPGEKATPEIKPPPTTRTAPLKQVMAF